LKEEQKDWSNPEEKQSPVEESIATETTRLEREIQKKGGEYQALNDKYLRSIADMDNQRKRMAREQAEAIKYANEKLFQDILPVVDNLERASLHAREKKDFTALIEGLNLTLREFLGVLDKFGIRPVESLGQPFDPARHHAVAQVESSEHEEGVVVEELRKGYLLNDRTLRPALVSVAKKPAAGAGNVNQAKSHDENIA